MDKEYLVKLQRRISRNGELYLSGNWLSDYRITVFRKPAGAPEEDGNFYLLLRRDAPGNSESM